MFLPTESLGNISTSENSFTLSTGSSDRAASSLGNFTTSDREFLKPFGTEGSAATISNLSTGTYSFDWSMYSKDKNGWDKLYAWNGKELTLIGDRASGTQISSARWTHDDTTATVDVIYDYVTFIALDENSKTGTTEFTINNFDYLAELPYEAPVQIDLTPDYLLGDIDVKSGYTSVGTGTGDRAISTLSQELGIDLSGMGTEGSIASWNLENGIYELTWKIYQTEDQRARDKVYLFNGNELEFFADGQNSLQTSATRYQTDWVTTEIEVSNGELTFLALDEIDKSGTTQLRIRSLEKIGSLEEPPFEEPPFSEIPFNDPDPEPILITEQELVGQLGSYEEFIDPVDLYEIPLGYNEGIEGFISVNSGSDLTLDIYDSDDNLYESYLVGSSPVSFNFGSDIFSLEIYTDNLDVLTEYSLSLNIGQVYDPN